LLGVAALFVLFIILSIPTKSVRASENVRKMLNPLQVLGGS
jgi:hypothetical protein